MVGPDLMELLRNHKSGDRITITKTNNHLDNTNYKSLQERYGKSTLYNDGQPLGKFIYDLATLTCFKIQIKLVDNLQLLEKTDKQILQFCLTNKRWRLQLKHANLTTIFHLWTRITKIPNPTTRKKGIQKLEATIKSKLNPYELPHNMLVLPYTEELNKTILRSMVKKILTSTLPNHVAQLLHQNIKILWKNRPSIADLLVNNKKAILNPDHPPLCLGKPHCQDDSHYSKPIHYKRGYSSMLKNISAKTIPIPDKTSVRQDIYTTLADTTKSSCLLNLAFLQEKPTWETKYQMSRQKSLRKHFLLWQQNNNNTTPLGLIPYKLLQSLWKDWNMVKENLPNTTTFLDTVADVYLSDTLKKEDIKNSPHQTLVSYYTIS